MNKGVLVIVAVLLSGCAANFQGLPRLVGAQGSKTEYSAHGFTDWGQTDPKDANAYAVKYAQAYCKTNPTVVRVITSPAHNMVGQNSLLWTAIYTCGKPAN